MILLIVDLLLLALSLPTTIFIRYRNDFSSALLVAHLAPFLILFVIWLAIFYILDLYDFSVIGNQIVFYGRLGGALALLATTGIIFFYFARSPSITPKTNFLIYLLIFGTLFILWRHWFYYRLRKVPRLLAIVGQNATTEKLKEEIAARPYLGYQLAELNPSESRKFDTIILASLGSNTTILFDYLAQGTAFITLPEAYELVAGKLPLDAIAETWFLEHVKGRDHWLYDKMKRLAEVALGALGLIITLPLCLIIALLIKLEDRGPVFFRQTRVGRHGKFFIILKFRSMRPDAEEAGATWAAVNDTRVTRVGRLLRRLHLDELPQLWNILRGEVSYVGPRPERPEFVSELKQKIPYYEMRHLVRPGLTGWAQVKFRYGRSLEDSFEKMQYDLYYLKNRSLALDFRILLKTIQLLFRNRE